MSVQDQIDETKGNGIKVTTPIIGKGTDDDPYRPGVFNSYQGAYFHVDAKDMDYENMVCEVWINKGRTPQALIDSVKNLDPDVKEITKET